MKLKIVFNEFEKSEDINEALKQEPIFIHDRYVDVKAGPELDWDHLFYVKIGDYYLSDIDYVRYVRTDDLLPTEIISEITLSKDDSIAMHIEEWEIEGVKNALKREIEILKRKGETLK